MFRGQDTLVLVSQEFVDDLLKLGDNQVKVRYEPKEDEFLEKYITKKYKNKLIILDNASSHRNEKIKELLNKHNTLLYSVPYQHFTNSIENYFSMMKSRLQKLDGLKKIYLKY